MKIFLPKPFLSVLFISALAAAAPLPAAGQTGGAAGYALYTDIAAYIGNRPIRSFNINGYTTVAVEDLAYYGFDVVWDAPARALYASRSAMADAADAPPYSPGSAGRNMVGKRAAAVLLTDIKCFFDGRQTESFNIGGKTIVYVDALAEMYAESYVWDDGGRALRLDLTAPWSADIENPGYDSNVTEIINGFALEIARRPGDGGTGFSVSDSSGDHAAIGSITVGDGGAGFSVYQNIASFGEFFNDLSACVSISYGERVAEDTAERRAALSRVLRVYVNGEETGGELSRSQGNGHADYRFVFDRRVSLDEVGTMRVEVGYRAP